MVDMSFNPTRPFSPPPLPPKDVDFNTPDILLKVVQARAELGELNGYSMAIPNPLLLMSPAIIQESVASSNIENINTTVVEFIQGQLFPEAEQRPHDKEVARYRQALLWGRDHLNKYAVSTRLIVGIQQRLMEGPEAGYRRQQNKIENSANLETLYTPPVASDVPQLINSWEQFVNSTDVSIDPLIRCALAHYQFEAIHPFSDGNGRTGRILMVLQLIEYKLLNFPILFVSGFLNRNRPDYYRLLRGVTTQGDWMSFVSFMLDAFYQQAKETKQTLFNVMTLHEELRVKMRAKHKAIYSADLVDHLFSQPITTPARLGEALDIHYTTASKYLHELASTGILKSKKVGKYHLFSHSSLIKLLKS
jgi:Fic family protein